MTKIFKSDSPVITAFDELVDTLLSLDHEWTDECARSEMDHVSADVRHHLCAAIALLAGSRATYDGLDGLDDGLRVLAREAYLAVLTLGQLVQRAWQDSLATPRALDQATSAVDSMLDALAPFVSRAETGLRRCLLEGEALEDVLASQAV